MADDAKPQSVGSFARARARPPQRALDWVIRTIGPGARVVRVRALRGSGNGMHVVTVQHGGETQQVVLRRVLFAEPAKVAERGWVTLEATVLQALDGQGVSAPRVLAYDPDGSECDRAGLITTLLPGSGRPPRRAAPAWLDSLAETLVAIHNVPVDRLPPLPDRLAQLADELAGAPPRSYADRPADLALRKLLQRRLAELRAAGPGPLVFVHDDYWSANTLRLGNRVTGVVDWQTPALGVPGVDVGYCAMDLELAYGKEARDRFVAAYERITGAPVEHLALWELAGALRAEDLTAWAGALVEFGLPVTEEVVRQRLVALESRVTAALDGS